MFSKNQQQQKRSVKGAGTALLAQIQSHATTAKKDLSLNSLPSAKEFYLNLGFIAENEDTAASSIPMTLKYST
ncbi:MAG TPA: GNAT family N-acetyltransferase [Rhabdochlamydiaceae bacterium]